MQTLLLSICGSQKMNFVIFRLFLCLVSLYIAFALGHWTYDRTHEIDLLRSDKSFLEGKIAAILKKQWNTSQGSKRIFAITPTYNRPVQMAELTRLGNTLQLVPDLLWILVEDSDDYTEDVTRFLAQYPREVIHLHVATPDEMKLKPKDSRWKKPRGVYQRNLALQWIKDHCQDENGVIYFMDDDNTYSLDLFEVIRGTERITVFPVGLVGGILAEKPRVINGKVVGWDVGWGEDREFATDMAGFAINLNLLLLNPSIEFAKQVRIGRQETDFLQQFNLSLSELEPVVHNRILVWHTRTEQPDLKDEEAYRQKHGYPSNYGMI